MIFYTFKPAGKEKGNAQLSEYHKAIGYNALL